MTDNDAYRIWFAALAIELERRLGWRGAMASDPCWRERFDEGASVEQVVDDEVEAAR